MSQELQPQPTVNDNDGQGAPMQHEVRIAPLLVPDEGDHAKRLNSLYLVVMRAMMNLFNSVGPKWAKQRMIPVHEGRGIFIACHQQMLAAIVASHFKWPGEKQQALNDAITQVIQAINATTIQTPQGGLLLPEHVAMGNPLTPIPSDEDLPESEVELDRANLAEAATDA